MILSEYLLDIDGALLNEAEFNVAITNSSKLFDTFNSIRQLAHPAMQNGTINLSDVAKMQLASSASELIHSLEAGEEKKALQQQQTEQMRMQSQEKVLQMQKELELLKHQQELEKIDKEWMYRLEIAKMETGTKLQQHSTDTNQNNIEDAVEYDMELLRTNTLVQLQDEKLRHEKEMQDKELSTKLQIEKIKATQKAKVTK